MHHHTTPPSRPARRQVLAGGAAAAAVWAAPSITRFDPVGAAVGSCADQSISWTGMANLGGGTYRATGSSGGVSITADITSSLSGGATPTASLTSGGRFFLGMSGHQIGDTWRVDFTFDAAPEAVCTATLTVQDVDQNDNNLFCSTPSRFRDEIFGVTGAGLSTSTAGALVQGPPGTWGSNTNCKTGDLENLTLTWTQSAGVTGAGFNWRAATPPGGSTTLDYQLIKVTPVLACVSGAAGLAVPQNRGLAASAALSSSAYDPYTAD